MQRGNLLPKKICKNNNNLYWKRQQIPPGKSKSLLGTPSFIFSGTEKRKTIWYQSFVMKILIKFLIISYKLKDLYKYLAINQRKKLVPYFVLCFLELFLILILSTYKFVCDCFLVSSNYVYRFHGNIQPGDAANKILINE